MLDKTLSRLAREAEAAAAKSRKQTSPTSITDAVYGKRPKRKPAPAPKPRREPRGTTIGEVIDPHTAAALDGLKAELESAKPKRRGRRS